MEIASNDGTFKKISNKKNLCVGVDPAKNIAKKANKEGGRHIQIFNNNFGKYLNKKYNSFDLVFARNVFPHF